MQLSLLGIVTFEQDFLLVSYHAVGQQQHQSTKGSFTVIVKSIHRGHILQTGANFDYYSR